MRELFFKTRNIAGIILIISPVLGTFSTDRPFFFYLLLLAGASAAVPLHFAGILFLPFRLWLFSGCLAAAAGLVLSELVSAGMLCFRFLYLSALFQGAACGGLLLLLPPLMAAGWFHRSKTMVLGYLWSVSLLLMPLWQTAFHQAAGWAIAASVFSMAAGIVFLQRPPVNYRRRENPLLLERSGNFIKPSVYTAAIAASLGMVISLSILVMPLPAQHDGGISFVLPSALQADPLSVLVAALPYCFLAASPVWTAFFMERRGVFSGCVLLIFLCESAVLCLGCAGSAAGGFDFSLGSGAAWSLMGSRVLPPAGCCLLAAAAGCLPVVLPILTHYLYGSINYLKSFGRLVFFLPAGLLASMPFCYLAAEGELTPEEPVIFLLCLLVLSFFCIFSAWKHRFIILKNKIL